MSVRRPALYFREHSTEYQSVSGRFVVPPQLRRNGAHAAAETLRKRIGDNLNAIRRERAGKSFLGRKALLRQDPFDAPRNQRPSHTRNPTVKAAGDGERYRLAKQAVRAFREAYRMALRKFRNGVTKALFPSGTLMMRKRFKVRCSADDFFWCCRATTPG